MASQEGWRDDGLLGLQVNLMRNGLLAFNLYDFDEAKIDEARLLVIVAPARRFSPRDVAIVRRYLENGGNVILSVGWEESWGAKPLLDEFDLELNERFPLGFFRTRSPALDAEAMFYKAWWIRDRSGKAQVICGHGKYPVIITKKIGKGNLVAIGDSNFLLNKNLESEKSYNEKNINFLRVLLAHLGVTGEAGR